MKGRITENTITHEAAAYADGDDLGAVFEITNAVPHMGATAKITSLTLLDKAKQNSALALLLFDSLPVVASSENAALNITDAIMSDQFIGVISIPSANYFSISASGIAVVDNIQKMVRAVAKATSIYGQLLCKGTPTYTSTTDLVLRLGFDQEG